MQGARVAQVKYPSWADKYIIDEAGQCSLAARLCSQENACELWKILTRHPEFKLTQPSLFKSPAHGYYWTCRWILENTGRLLAITPSQYKVKSRKIANLAKELANELSSAHATIRLAANGKMDSLYGNDEDHIEQFNFSHNESTAFGNIDQSLIISMVSGIEMHSIHHPSLCESIQESREDLRQNSEKHHEIPLTSELIKAKIIVGTSKLTISELLNELASKIEEEQYDDLYVKRASSDGILKQAFARQLHEYHMGKFGIPLWDALAIATTIAINLDEPLSADDIRPIIKGGGK